MGKGKIDYVFVRGNSSSCKVCLERGPKATYALLESHQAIEATGEWPSDHGCEAVTVVMSRQGFK